jgi:hypothetical protein
MQSPQLPMKGSISGQPSTRPQTTIDLTLLPLHHYDTTNFINGHFHTPYGVNQGETKGQCGKGLSRSLETQYIGANGLRTEKTKGIAVVESKYEARMLPAIEFSVTAKAATKF